MVRLLVSLIGLIWFVLPAHAQSPSRNVNVAELGDVEAFVAELQRASQTGDRNTVAVLIQYPVTVTISGIRVRFADAGALLDRYDAIFTPTLQDEIAHASTTTATVDGVVIGTNALVVKRIGEQLRITEINVPAVDPASTSVSADPKAAPPAGRDSEPRRVGVGAGPRPTQFSGSLLPSETDVYMMWIEKGKLLQVRLERAPTGAAFVRVVHAGTRALFNPRVPNPGRVVTGIAPQSADYRIEVRRAAARDAAPLPYRLSVTLR
jgi:hypothetical protein